MSATSVVNADVTDVPVVTEFNIGDEASVRSDKALTRSDSFSTSSTVSDGDADDASNASDASSTTSGRRAESILSRSLTARTLSSKSLSRSSRTGSTISEDESVVTSSTSKSRAGSTISSKTASNSIESGFSIPSSQQSPAHDQGDNPKKSVLECYQRHVLKLTNHQRAKHNAPPVQLHPLLNQVARAHNADIAFKQKALSHTGHDGSSLGQRFLRGGYDFRYATENIARGQKNCEWVVRSWMGSPGHRRNIINARVRDMGLHVGRGADGKLYWCQVFGQHR